MKLLVKTFQILVLVPLFISCGTSDNIVKIKVDGNGYPLIENALFDDDALVLTSINENIGSIGYELNNEITWVKGLPEINFIDSVTEYTWKNEEIKMSIIKSGMDVEYELMYINEENVKPSKWYLNVKAQEGEYFTGLFERVVDGRQNNSWADNIQTAMDLRGETVEMKLKPTVSAYAPFYVSSANYGMFVKGTWPGMYDFCKSTPDVVKISFEGPSLAFKVYSGTMAEIVQKHTMETGPTLVPPRWAFGPWRWRDEHFNDEKYFDGTVKKAPFNTDVVEDVLMMEAFDIPHTAVWIDRPWAPGKRGFDDYEFDLDRIPLPEEMIKWLNEKDLELMMWIGPFVMGDMADYAEEKGYHLQSNRWKNSRQVLMDFTNEEGNEWWGENGPGKLARMGIKGFKLDRADGEKLTDSIHLYTSNGKTYRENYNDYPRQYVKATYDAVSKVLGDDFVLFPRAQYTGSAKYGSMWAGDTNGKQEGLRSAIIAMLRCSVIGYHIWGSDIGGYWGQFDREVTKRWLGFGCFSPIMEVGPTNNKGFWDNPPEYGLVYDTTLIATWRLYSKIRMELIDYVREQAILSNKTGMPVARPLFLIYPDQEEAWNDWQTYLFGPDILVSAVWKKGVTKHRLYLPKGETWIDAWNKKEYSGGEYVEVDA